MAKLTFGILSGNDKDSYRTAMKPLWKAYADAFRKMAIDANKAKAGIVVGNIIATIFAVPTWGASYLAATATVAAKAAIDLAANAGEVSRADAKRKLEHDKRVTELRRLYNCDSIDEASFEAERDAYVKSLM